MSPRKTRPADSRIPSRSLFYDKIVPALLVGMAILTVLFILVALGVLFGLISY